MKDLTRHMSHDCSTHSPQALQLCLLPPVDCRLLVGAGDISYGRVAMAESVERRVPVLEGREFEF